MVEIEKYFDLRVSLEWLLENKNKEKLSEFDIEVDFLSIDFPLGKYKCHGIKSCIALFGAVCNSGHTVMAQVTKKSTSAKLFCGFSTGRFCLFLEHLDKDYDIPVYMNRDNLEFELSDHIIFEEYRWNFLYFIPRGLFFNFECFKSALYDVLWNDNFQSFIPIPQDLKKLKVDF